MEGHNSGHRHVLDMMLGWKSMLFQQAFQWYQALDVKLSVVRVKVLY